MDFVGFFDALYRNCDGAQIELRAIHPTGGSKASKFIPFGEWGKIWPYCKQNSSCNLYFAVATRNGGGTKDKIHEIPALWCDLDFKDVPEQEAIKRVQDFPIEPTLVIRSGGGFQLYWILKEPSTREEIPQHEKALKAIASYLGGDMAATDASRILRIPGTQNLKYSPPRPVLLTKAVPEKEYNIPSLLELVTQYDLVSNTIIASSVPVHKCPQESTDVVTIDFTPGHQDNSLFHIANCLCKGGMSFENGLKTIEFLAQKLDPSCAERWSKAKIESAFNRSQRKRQSLAEEVREWVLSTSGHFLSTDIHKCLQLSTRQDTKNVSEILRRMIEDKLIQRVGSKNGQFRRIEEDCSPLHWQSASASPLGIEWPFQIEQWVNIYPGNIIVVAGEPNAGKTAFLLNFAALNQDSFPIRYFSSEMGEEELQLRLRLFEKPDEFWKTEFFERSSNFPDIIQPDVVNIIDFLEIHDNFFEVGGILAAIHAKLGKGIAVVAIQKPPGRDLAKGGYMSIEKPRLYLSLSNEKTGHRVKIVKAKNYAQKDKNPNGLSMFFTLRAGNEIRGDWRWERLPQ